MGVGVGVSGIGTYGQKWCDPCAAVLGGHGDAERILGDENPAHVGLE